MFKDETRSLRQAGETSRSWGSWAVLNIKSGPYRQPVSLGRGNVLEANTWAYPTVPTWKPFLGKSLISPDNRCP